MVAVRAHAVDGVVHPHELAVGLVDDDEHVRGDLREEGVELGLGDGRPGRVVGGAHQHHPRPVGHGGGHRVEVVATVREHRHPTAAAAAADRDRVGLEGAPREDDLVAGIAERLHQLVDQADRPGGQGEVVGGDAELLRQRLVQRRAPMSG